MPGACSGPAWRDGGRCSDLLTGVASKRARQGAMDSEHALSCTVIPGHGCPPHHVPSCLQSCTHVHLESILSFVRRHMSLPATAGDELTLRAIGHHFGIHICVATGEESQWLLRFPPPITLSRRQLVLAWCQGSWAPIRYGIRYGELGPAMEEERCRQQAAASPTVTSACMGQLCVAEGSLISSVRPLRRSHFAPCRGQTVFEDFKQAMLLSIRQQPIHLI